ncbi:MAG: acyl-CoA desaturase [Micropruina sp.]
MSRRTRSFTELAKAVRGRGLNDRTPGFYLTVAAALIVALGGAFTGLVLLRDSWLLLLIAAAFGIIFTQFAFLGHEASHRQVLTSGPANDRLGRVLSTVFVGISYAWWMNKHTRHHGNPNRVAKDPDIESAIVSFSAEDALASTGLRRWITRRQGWLFFVLLLFLGLELHLSSFIGLFARRRIQGRGVEVAMLVGRFAVYLGLLFWLVPVGLAFAFLGVQFAVFGLYMGITFSPNHIGMPLVPKDSRLDFLDKQVLTSRNVSGGWFMTALMGGLNYQIEHHLFPSMPRPHLWKARQLVQEHCAEHGVPYTETNLARALGIVVAHMNRVGLAAAREFRCPTAGVMGRR